MDDQDMEPYRPHFEQWCLQTKKWTPERWPDDVKVVAHPGQYMLFAMHAAWLGFVEGMRHAARIQEISR